MSVFSATIDHRSFWWQISAVCFVLGLLLAAAAFTANQVNSTGVRPNNPALSYGSGIQVAIEKSQQYESELKKERERNTELENKLARGDDAASTLNKQLQDTKFLAGLTEVVGPGVQITLTDAPKSDAVPGVVINAGEYIHDFDVANVVNELKACGAEAIAVNGQRIGASTAVRCNGPVIHVNSVPVAPPYVVHAIGDPDTLFNGMNISRGVLDELRRANPKMVLMDKKKQLLLPAYAGSTQMRYARPKSSSKGSEPTPDKEGSKDKT